MGDSGAPQPAPEANRRAAEKAAAEAKKHQTEAEATMGAKEDDKKDEKAKSTPETEATEKEKKAQSARGQKRERESGHSSAPQPADPRKEEKRYAPNNRAYTKDEFFAYWPDPNEAQQQWDDAKTTPPQQDCMSPENRFLVWTLVAPTFWGYLASRRALRRQGFRRSSLLLMGFRGFLANRVGIYNVLRSYLDPTIYRPDLRQAHALWYRRDVDPTSDSSEPELSSDSSEPSDA